MLIIGICILVLLVMCFLCYKAYDEEYACLYVISIIAIVVAGLVMLCAVLSAVEHSIDYISDRAQAELQAKHDAIVAVIEKDKANYITLSDSISEYNAAVLKGRRSMDDIWFRDFDYDFYYEMELIEL